MYENSLEKYQKDTWARTMNRKHIEGERIHAHEKVYTGEQMTKNQKGHGYPENPSKKLIN